MNAPEQLKADDELLAKLRDHTKSHIDVYPFVLQVLNTVLRSAQEADSLGGLEPELLESLHCLLEERVAFSDPSSRSFFEKSIYESPR